MADNTSRGPKGTRTQIAPGIPARQVRGDAWPDELAAVAAVLAILATAGGDGDAAPTDPHAPAGWRHQSRWGSPRQMIRTTLPHGSGAWRASALSR